MPEARTLQARVRRVPLDFVGPDWSDAYVDLRYLTWADTKRIREGSAAQTDEDKAVEALLTTLSDVFVSGKAVADDGQLIDITAADLASLDMDTLGRLYQAALGVADPKD